MATNDQYAYAAVMILLLVCMAGAGVAGYLFVRLLRGAVAKHVYAVWLLAMIAGLSVGQFIEQIRVLIFRLSFDGVIDRSWFEGLYDNLYMTVGSKLLFAISLAAGTGLKLALFCDRSERETMEFAFIGAGTVVGMWVGACVFILFS